MPAASTTDALLAARTRPAGRVAMYQSWRDLLFLHWSFDPELIQKTLPDGLTVDTFDGKAWVGIVPFFMRNVRHRWTPTFPGLSNFQEINVRTYAVVRDGTPGVWFYSLDANCWPAVQVARRWFRLPYRWSTMTHALAERRLSYSSHLRGRPAETKSSFEYHLLESVAPAEPGTLEFFLIERYVLFAVRRRGVIATGRVAHHPYQIAQAVVDAWDSNLFGLGELPLPAGDFEHACYSPGVDVEVFGLT
jgi:uncharacterized protein YqjF (DUF2071 family)